MKDKKNIFILALLLAIVFMSIGYAALSSVLNINGTANVDESWNVKIISIDKGDLVGATIPENKAPSFTATSATFEVDLEYPGASATFDITVENAGSIDAKLDSIVGVDTINDTAPLEIVYEVKDADIGAKLAAGAKDVITVTVTWKSDDKDKVPEVKTKVGVITLNYSQFN